MERADLIKRVVTLDPPKHWCSVVFLALVWNVLALATAGSVSGTVREGSGNPLSGAKVTLTNEKTVLSVSTSTSKEGRYSFVGVEPGIYAVIAEIAGFRGQASRRVTVSAGENRTIDLSMVHDEAGKQVTRPDSSQPAADVEFYDVNRLKQGELDKAVAYGAHSAPRQAQTAANLLQGAAQIRTNTVAGQAEAKLQTGPAKNAAAIELQLKEAVRLTPGSFAAQHSLGEFYLREGKPAAAVLHLEKAQQIDPVHNANNYDLALAYFLAGNLSRARQQIQNLLQKKETAELHNLLGDVEEKAGNTVAAAGEYQKAAHMEPSEKHLFDWGNHLLLHQAYEPAAQVFSHSVTRYPGSARLRIGLGIAQYSRGQYDEAVKFLCEAADLDPEDPHPYLFLGKMYGVSTSMTGEVNRRLAQFVELHPKNAQAHYYYAMNLWKGQRGQEQTEPGKIESELNTAVALDPKLSEAHFQLGVLYSDQRRHSEAIRALRQAIQLQPSLDEAHYRLGQAYQRTGQRALAAQQFEIYKRLHEQKTESRQDREKTEALVPR
jgi:tetratricopeptide (TPR) repeat protein